MQGWGAVLGAGFRWSPWKGRGQTAGHSSSPLEEVTASLRHEAEHPLATSSQPQPGLSWAGGTSPVPMVAAVSTDHILVSPSPLWGAPWQMCGHMAGTTGAGSCGGHSVCPSVCSPQPVPEVLQDCGVQDVLTAIQEPCLGWAWGLEHPLQCVQLAQLDPIPRPELGLGHGILDMLQTSGLPWSCLLAPPGGPRHMELSQTHRKCPRDCSVPGTPACRAMVEADGVCCARGLERGRE